MPAEPRSVGQSLPCLDALDRVTGQARYAGDLDRPRRLPMKIRVAVRPPARMVRLAAARAAAYPGVVAILALDECPVLHTEAAFADRRAALAARL